ncbi:MAG: alpha/beta hydrolase domain-containing protein [Pseudohongiella sp.]|nr:alpha/beta hydrolase domain-containing protein [Pseudohongiella sp.]
MMRNNKTYFAGPVLLILATLLASPLLAQVPAALVTGPVPAAPHGDPGRNSQLNPNAITVAGIDYIEEEFFIEGVANRYSTPELQTGEVTDSGHPYKTRFIVRRPADASHFNGTLVVEWNNVTGSRDLDIDWWQSGAHLMREGYAFIAVSAQRVGVNHMREWSALRYGDLDVTHDGMVTDDALSYDIFSAVAKSVVRSGETLPVGATDVLSGLRPSMILATGHSQSASRLATYINNVHGLDPVYDGFMVHGGGGRIRDDQPVKIFRVMAETDMATRAATPQPDSNNFRHWEVAGTSHVDVPFELEYAMMVALEDGRRLTDPQPRNPVCDKPTYSHVPFRHVMNAAFEHLRNWIAEDIPPPRAPAMLLAQTTAPVSFARDQYGNVLGGIRLAEHAVPTATNTGINSGDSFCRLYGSHEPFALDTLKTLYPSPESYISAVRRVVEQNLADGFILPVDAQQTIRQAESSAIDRW